jgi:hypothetical protein
MPFFFQVNKGFSFRVAKVINVEINKNQGFTRLSITKKQLTDSIYIIERDVGDGT